MKRTTLRIAAAPAPSLAPSSPTTRIFITRLPSVWPQSSSVPKK